MAASATLRLGNLRLMVLWLLRLLGVAAQIVWARATNGARCHTTPAGLRKRVNSTTQRWTAVVTGASSGLGEAVVERLAARGVAVVMACRSVARGTEAAERILARHPEADLEVWQLDVTDSGQILAFAARLQAAQPSGQRGVRSTGPEGSISGVAEAQAILRAADTAPICQYAARLGTSTGRPGSGGLPPVLALIHCAAVLTDGRRTVPGLQGPSELMLITNHVGPAALQLCMLPMIYANASKAGANGAIVSTGSFTHLAAGLRGSCLSLQGGQTRQFLPAQEYMNSKFLLTAATQHLYNVMHTDHDGLLRVRVADPGAVDSQLIREWPAWLRHLFWAALHALQLLNRPILSAAAVEAALFDESGACYWANLRGVAAPLQPAPDIRRPSCCQEVWDLTVPIALAFLASQGTDERQQHRGDKA